MKFYCLLSIMIASLPLPLQAQGFIPKWIDTLTSKFNNTTDVITHKEFKHAQQLQLHNMIGSIVINSWKQDSIAIEIIESGSHQFHKNIKIDMEQIEDLIKIHTIFLDEALKGSVIFNILLPDYVDLAIFTQQGEITIKDIHGSIDIQTLQGSITLHNTDGNVDAQTRDGNIVMRTQTIQPDKKCTLASGKGNVELSTTTMLQTSINAQALAGKVQSQIPVTLASQTTELNPAAWKKFQQSVQGTIGNPQAELNIVAYQGSITITNHTIKK